MTSKVGQPLRTICVALLQPDEAYGFATLGLFISDVKTSRTGTYKIANLAPGRYAIEFNGCGTKNYVSLPNSAAQYAIELLPTPGHTSCSTSDASSMVSSAGEFRIRVTGRPSSGSTTRRQIIATFRPKGFLN